MANNVTVSFSNDGNSGLYVVNNNDLANDFDITNVLGVAAITENVSGGAVDPTYVVPATAVSAPVSGTVGGDYTTVASTDEAYKFVAEGWNQAKNISVVASGDDSILFIADNFVHADMDFSDVNNTVELRIYDGKRGNYITGSGDDRIEITTATNNKGWTNKHNVQTGDGDDIVIINNGDSSLIGETIVKVTNGSLTTIEADLGNGNDVYVSDNNVRTKDYVFGGKGEDTIYTGMGNDILEGGEDRGVIAELSPNLYDLIAKGDTLFGGEGVDTFKYTSADGFGLLGDGFDHIVDFENHDILDLTLQGTDVVTTDLATVQTIDGDMIGTMVSINSEASIFLEDFFTAPTIV